MKHQHIIYIPGLGDSKLGGQALAIKTWRFWGVTPHLFQMNWADGEAFAPKFARLLERIDELSKTGTVSVVAASAGASAALNAFAARTKLINGVVTIAGKINNPEAIGGSYKSKNPAFWESAHESALSLDKLTDSDRKRILSIRGAADPIVPARDSKLAGANNKVVPTVGHATTIAGQLLFGAPSFLRFLKQL